MTVWDFIHRLTESVPGIVLVLALSTWCAWHVLRTALDFLARRKNPEQALRGDMQELLKFETEHVNRLRTELRDAERRVGRLLITVRALETAMERCARDCPKCREHFNAALERARQQALIAGLVRKDDHTLPGLDY